MMEFVFWLLEKNVYWEKWVKGKHEKLEYLEYP